MKWIKTKRELPQSNCPHLMRSADVLAVDNHGTVRVAFVQYHDCKLDEGLCPDFEWKLAGRDFYDFENVVGWMPLSVLPSA